MSKRKTLGVKPYGRLPLQDSKDDARVTVTPENIKNGVKNRPAGCALALAVNEAPDGTFPGDYLACRVNKTHTIIISTIGQRVQARRYMHDEATRRAINGFDGSTSEAFPPEGLTITLKAPIGARKSGTHKKTNKTGRKFVPGKPRVSRSVYRYNIDKVAADRVARA